MKNTIDLLFAVLFTAAMLVIGADQAIAQDASIVDSKHYKVEFENEHVRVLRVSYGVKEKSMMHQHPEGLAISLTAMQGKFTLADGKSENRTFKPGDVRWTPAETHAPENTGGKPFEVILIELKDGSGGGNVTATDDPIKADPKHHRVVFENDRVRVLRGLIAPKTRTKMHAHPGNVVIFLSDASVRSTLADGKVEQVQAKAGQASWRDYVKHDAENVSDKPLDVMVVELKSKP